MHGRKRKGAAAFAVLIIASLAIVASAFARADVAPAAAAAPSAGCDSPRIGFQGPITGDAAFIGKEQLGFAQYAIKKLGGGKIKLLAAGHAARSGAGLDRPGRSSTPTRTSSRSSARPAARRCSRSRRSSRRGSGCRSSPARPRAPSLTNGSIPNFFRVVPNDSVQAPTTAKYIRQILKAKERLHRRRPDGVLEAAGERRAGEPAGRRRQGDAELGQPEGDRLLVARLQDRRRRRRRLPALADRGQRPDLRAADEGAGQERRHLGLGRPRLRRLQDRRLPTSSAFAPDIRGIKGNAAFIKGYGKKFVSNFGPPMYVATQAAIAAINEGVRGRQRHPRGGAEAAQDDVPPEDRARRQPAVHRARATSRARSSTSSSSAPAARRRWSVRRKEGRSAEQSLRASP